MSPADDGSLRAAASDTFSSKRLLHVGCGPKSPNKLHPTFRDKARWDEIRLDVDARVTPDIICSAVDMRRLVAAESFDALWSSHTVEHLFEHEIAPAFREFRRVLKPGGFALIRCPDFQAVVDTIATTGLEGVAYVSPAGPITPLDMVFGHRASIARGNSFMAHRTAFTDERLGRMLLEAGFAEVFTKRAAGFDLWAMAITEGGRSATIIDDLAVHGLDFRT